MELKSFGLEEREAAQVTGEMLHVVISPKLDDEYAWRMITICVIDDGWNNRNTGENCQGHFQTSSSSAGRGDSNTGELLRESTSYDLSS